MKLLQISRIFGAWPFNKKCQVRLCFLVYSYSLFAVASCIFYQYVFFVMAIRDMSVQNWFRVVFEVSRTFIRCCLWLSHLWAVTRTVNTEKSSLRCITSNSYGVETVLSIMFTTGICFGLEPLAYKHTPYWASWQFVLKAFQSYITYTTQILIIILFISGVDNLVATLCEQVPLKSTTHQIIALQGNTLRKAKELNDFFHIQLLLNTASTFMTLSSEGYYLINRWMSGSTNHQTSLDIGNTYSRIEQLIWFVLSLYWLYRLTRSCENFYEKIEKLNDQLFEAVKRNDFLRVDERFQLHVIRKPSFEFTAMRFFPIGYPLISSVVAAAATYLVILIELSTS